MTTNKTDDNSMHTQVSVAQAKAQLSELLRQVEAGVTVTITRRGEPVAVLSLPKRPLPSRKAWLANQPKSEVSSIDLIRDMRDQGY